MTKKSAGILLYRLKDALEVFLVHPGGPFFAKKDIGSWSIPKGEFTEPETPLQAALREFKEETGTEPASAGIELTPVKLKSGKLVYAWAIEGDIDPEMIQCNSFTIEWPPRSGTFREFPEIDKGEWFTYSQAKEKINPAQSDLIEELVKRLGL